MDKKLSSNNKLEITPENKLKQIKDDRRFL